MIMSKILGAIILANILATIFANHNSKFTCPLLNKKPNWLMEKQKRSLCWPLNKIEEFWRNSDKIMFVETSGRSYLLPRQLCSIESACRNSDLPVLVLMLTDALDLDHAPTANFAAMGCQNVHIRRLDPLNLIKEAKLDWSHSPQILLKKILASENRVAHLSDLCRLLLLYLLGGWYSDIDAIILRSLNDLATKNAGAEVLFSTDQYFPSSFQSEFDENGHRNLGTSVSNGFMFARKSGIKFFKSVLDKWDKMYRPELWTSGGADIVTKVVSDQCNLGSNNKRLYLTVGSVSVERCSNLQLLEPRSSFFPYSWPESHFWWQPGKSVKQWQQFLNNATSLDLFASSTKSHEKPIWEQKYYGGAMPVLAAIGPLHCPTAFKHVLVHRSRRKIN